MDSFSWVRKLQFLCAVFLWKIIQVTCENDTIQLPNLYNLEEYEGCIENNKLYCKAFVKLAPRIVGNFSYRWSIPGFSKTWGHFPNNVFKYGLCIEPNRNRSEEELILSHYDRHYKTGYYYLQSVWYHACKREVARVATIDVLFGLVVVLYILFAIWITLKEIKWRKQPQELNTSKLKKFLSCLSLKKSWDSLVTDNQFGDTKCLQGIRLLAMCWIIFLHSVASQYSRFTQNPNDKFMMRDYPLVYYIVLPITINIVQWFFFLSAFLLATQVHDLHEKNGAIKIKDVLLLLLNRYLRLIPPIVILLVGMMTNIGRIGIHGPNFDLFDLESIGCYKNWWITMLLFNNNLDTKCFKGIWYVSADMQLYAGSLVMLYLMYRFRNVAYRIFAACLIGVIMLQGFRSYRRHMPGVLYLYDDTFLKFELTIISKEFGYLYFHTLANAGSYLVGLGFGLVYSDKEARRRLQSILSGHTCWIGHCAISLLVYYLCAVSVKGLLGNVIGSLLKPMYAFSIGIFAFGLILNPNAKLRKLFEHNVVQILARVTYCTYVYHYIFVFQKTLRSSQLTEVSPSSVMEWYLADVVISFVLGTVIHLLLEAPAIRLQKLYIPQVRKARVPHLQAQLKEQ